MSPKTPEPLLDSTETATWIGVPVGTLDQWSYRHIGPRFYKVGRHRRYRVADVETWLASRARGGDAA